MMRRRVFLASFVAIGVTGCLSGDGNEDRIEEQGEIEIAVNGNPIDLTQERLQAENAENASLSFHFHDGDALWYMEGERVTFAEGIDLLPYFAYERRNGSHVLTYDGTRYDESNEETEITFTVDGETVDPTEYELKGGEKLRVDIETARTEQG